MAEVECPVCYSEPKYMIENVNSWFHKFERTKINTPKTDQKYTFESLGDEISDRAEEYHTILVVLNTKSAVRRLYDILRTRNIKVEYLTTNLCAEHRSDKIKSIRETLKKKQEKIVVVSTNLIEAGVDISFECVYRSMTGLDSLAQTAGRCNRNGEVDCGILYLIRLEDEDVGNMEELQQNSRITENIIYQYSFPIKELDTNIVELLSKGFVPKEKRSFMNQAYKTAGHAYRVIEDYSFGVIVPYKKGAEIIEHIQQISDIPEIKDCIRQAQRYTVNVRGSQLEKFEGLIQVISDKIPNLYMVAAPGAYNSDYGITPEWETLIF